MRKNRVTSGLIKLATFILILLNWVFIVLWSPIWVAVYYFKHKTFIKSEIKRMHRLNMHPYKFDKFTIWASSMSVARKKARKLKII